MTPEHEAARPRVRTRLQDLELTGPAGTLEALLQEREDRRHATIAIVCHPHPLYGGTLHNKVVHRVASVLHELGAAVLRFNFRGVGGSAGRFDEGDGELDDARAALAFLRERHPEARSRVAGFSFGSWIAARLAASDPGIEQLTLVAPPIRTSSFEVMRSAAVPKLVLQGTRDEICPPELLEQEFPSWAEPKRRILVEEASHFFDRQLGALARALREGLSDPRFPRLS